MPRSCEAPSVAARIGAGLLPHSSSKSCTMAAGLWGSVSPGDACSLGALGSAACSAAALSSGLHSFPEVDKLSFRLLVTATWLLVLGADPGPSITSSNTVATDSPGSSIPKAAATPTDTTSSKESSEPPPAASSPEEALPTEQGPAATSSSRKRGRKRGLRNRPLPNSSAVDLDSSGEFASIEKMLATTDTNKFSPFLQTAEDDTQEEVAGAPADQHGPADEEQGSPAEDRLLRAKRNSYANCLQKINCPHCPRVFPWASSLQRHMLTHTDSQSDTDTLTTPGEVLDLTAQAKEQPPAEGASEISPASQDLAIKEAKAAAAPSEEEEEKETEENPEPAGVMPEEAADLDAEAMPESLRYEELVRRNVELFIATSQKFIQETELSQRIRDWEDTIQPLLQEQEQHVPFDIHIYGDQLASRFPQLNEWCPFSELVAGQPAFEVCRSMLASLQLANDYTVEITQQPGLEAAVDTMSLRLLTHQRAHTRFQTYAAPSMAQP